MDGRGQAKICRSHDKSYADMSEPTTAMMLQRSKLPVTLDETLATLTKQYAAGDYQEDGAGQARNLTFPDGSIWFPAGIEKDNPWTFAALFLGIATFALLVVTSDAFQEDSAAKWPLVVACVVAAVATNFSWRVHKTRTSRSLREIAMGTLATPDHLLLLAYEEAFVIPKSRIRHFETVQRRASQRRSVRLHVKYQDDSGETLQRYVGFLYGSDAQKAQLEQAQAKLDEWLAS
jgi:hypothetical protein